MPNHVHLIAVPESQDGLRAMLGEAHRRYTARTNARHRWTGHLWQGRFGSVAMDEDHLANAIRYVSLNPVRAKLVKAAEDWPWSSVRAHLAGRDDPVVKVAPALSRIHDFAGFLTERFDETAAFAPLRAAETIGRPLGSKVWISQLEREAGRSLAPRPRGPRPRAFR